MLGIAARSPSKLDALKQSLALDERVLTVHVDVTQPAQVDAVVLLEKVVISAVGPYWRWGTEVVSCAVLHCAKAVASRTCARHGAHYVDLTGETP